MGRWAAALFSIALLLNGCAGGFTQLAGKLDSAITAAMKSAGVPGALVGIWSPEGEYVRAFGVTDTATGLPMETDFYSRIGSVTKTFTATAVLELVTAGKVGLDDPIARYLAGVPNGDRITVRQLASMRSGLTDYTKVDGFGKAVTADPQHTFTPADLLDWAFSVPVQFPPGEKFDYSNTNYVVLGLLVEKVGAAALPDYIAEQILTPLGLARTSFPTGTRFPTPHPHGYTDPDDGGRVVDATDWNASITWAAGAMISTLEDMRIWVSALAAGPLPGTIGAGPSTELRYGMGIFTVAGWIGHNGSVPGYQTVAVYLPERETTLVVMLNTDIATADGTDPSTVLATAITSVITPDHVYKI